MKTNYHQTTNKLLSLLALMLVYLSGQAQITTQPDKGYTFKSTCVDFYPSNNDTLAAPATYKAYVSANALHGTFTIDSTMPFKATYCPFPNYLGKDTMYYKICDATQTICGISSIIFNIENQSIANVWPGDCNNDGEVNALDVLFLSNSMQTQGPAGFNRTSTWGPSFCDDWNINTWGVNNKYIDGDGNGIIDLNDFNNIQTNIAKARSVYFNVNNYNPYKTNTSLPLYTKVRKTNLKKGDTIMVDLFFGDTSGLLENQKIVTGFACFLTIDTTMAIALKNSNAWFEAGNNWILQGLGTNKLSLVNKRTDRLAFDLAFSRTDHYCSKTNYTTGCNQLSLSLTTRDKTSASNLAEIYTSVSGGASPYNYFWSTGSNATSLSGLNVTGPTATSLTIVDANNCTVSGQVTVMDRSGAGRGEVGTLKVIVDDDIYQLTGNQNNQINFMMANPHMIDNLIPEFINVVKYQAAYGKPNSAISNIEQSGTIRINTLEPGKYEMILDDQEQIDKIYLTDITGREISHTQDVRGNKAVVQFHSEPGQLYVAIINTNEHFYSIKLK